MEYIIMIILCNDIFQNGYKSPRTLNSTECIVGLAERICMATVSISPVFCKTLQNANLSGGLHPFTVIHTLFPSWQQHQGSTRVAFVWAFHHFSMPAVRFVSFLTCLA